MTAEPFVDFKGMRVLVSGASSGIGRAIAVELSRRGAGLILVGRNRERLHETAERAGGGGCHVLVLDLENVEDIGPRVKQISSEIGPIYGLCHAAGIVETLPLAVNDPKRTRRMLEVNLIAGIQLARVVSRRDVAEPAGGSILFISSIYGHVGAAGQIGYCASKGAVAAAGRAMAVELARRNIRVNTLSPGMVRTAMTEKALSILSEVQLKQLTEAHPLGIGKPEDVARAAVFLLAPQNTWMTGTDVVIDGGYTAN